MIQSPNLPNYLHTTLKLYIYANILSRFSSVFRKLAYSIPLSSTEPEPAAPTEEEIIAEDYDDTPQQTAIAYTPVESHSIDPYMVR